jgi:hypothetical protein
VSEPTNVSIPPFWVILLKFGKKQHLEEFRENGLVYMNSRTFFSRLENDCVRADSFEGTDRIIQPHDTHVTIEGPIQASCGHIETVKVSLLPGDLAGPVSIGWNKNDCNMFCMFSVTKPIDGELVDRRNLNFDDSFVLVLNTQEFINRFSVAADTDSLRFEYRRVDYYDADTHSGETGTFRKPAIFSYQNEFRFIVSPGTQEPRKLILGSLLDITTPVLPLSEINQLIDFGTESARKARIS